MTLAVERAAMGYSPLATMSPSYNVARLHQIHRHPCSGTSTSTAGSFDVCVTLTPGNITLDDQEKRSTGREACNVSFPDVPEGLTCGWSWQEAIEMAEDCLIVALYIYVKGHQDLPVPSPLAEDQILISLPAIAAASLAVYSAMRKQGITKADMSEKLKVSEDAVCKLLDPRYRTHMSQLEKALNVVGRSLIIEDQEIAYSTLTHSPAKTPLSPHR